jgi:flagellar biosynthesis/type III secretory pathway protein FliH
MNWRNTVTVADEIAFASLPEDVRALAEKLIEYRIYSAYTEGVERGREARFSEAYQRGLEDGRKMEAEALARTPSRADGGTPE